MVQEVKTGSTHSLRTTQLIQCLNIKHSYMLNYTLWRVLNLEHSHLEIAHFQGDSKGAIG